LNLDLNETQKLLQRTVREFAEAEVKPLAREIDETGHFPRETFRKAAELVEELLNHEFKVDS
jgi:butyryl-CoA dehydrogenase